MSEARLFATTEQMLIASNVAVAQMIRKVRLGRKTDHGGSSKRDFALRWGQTACGILGEIIASDKLGVPWTPGGCKITRGDLAHKIEVRFTEYESGHLKVDANDPEDHIVIGVVGDPMRGYRIIGGILVADARRPEWFGTIFVDPRAYAVPQSALRPFEELGT
jgi:hypothetical protein